MSNITEAKRIYRHRRIRKKVMGTSGQPRLCVHRSLKNLYAQVIDDSTGKTIFGLSTLNKDLRGKIKHGGDITSASTFGEFFASQAKAKGVTKVCFDRGGYLYHGRIKAFAEALRKGGLEF
jgi:large subunit ribosomal protein L18